MNYKAFCILFNYTINNLFGFNRINSEESRLARVPIPKKEVEILWAASLIRISINISTNIMKKLNYSAPKTMSIWGIMSA